MLDHVALGTRLKLFDLERAGEMSGSGFICFTGAGAKLERALDQFPARPAHPRARLHSKSVRPFWFGASAWSARPSSRNSRRTCTAWRKTSSYLAPTAEVPVTNFHREEILRAELAEEIRRLHAVFPSRSGLGRAGTRGIIRVHQFDKVELVKITTPEKSSAEHESLTADAERVLQLLGLHYRVIELCTGDLGFGSAKTYDIEVWAPGQNAYLEVSSCSNFEDFQARRMNLRFKERRRKKSLLPHTERLRPGVAAIVRGADRNRPATRWLSEDPREITALLWS